MCVASSFEVFVTFSFISPISARTDTVLYACFGTKPPFMYNANSIGKICVADICAKMAVGHAQIGVEQNFSYGYFCYELII